MRSISGLFLTSLALASQAFANGQVEQPTGAQLWILSPGPDATAWIQHFPYRNMISWEIEVKNGTCNTAANSCATGPTVGQFCNTDTDCQTPLNFTGGMARVFDADGNVIDSKSVTPAEFDDIVRYWGRNLNYVPLKNLGECNQDPSLYCSRPGQNDPANCDPDGSVGDAMCNGTLRPNAGYVPDGRFGIPFPLESIAHNQVPVSAEMEICFAEHGNTAGNCPNPLAVREVALAEYRAKESYIFPSPAPQNITCVDTNGDPTGAVPTLFSGSAGGHEINTNHRFARNQRYALDYGIACDGNEYRGITANDNNDAYIYGQPVIAQADGVVVVYEGGHPENTHPPDLSIKGFCNTRRCDGTTTDTCVADSDPAKSVIPGSGNQLVIQHDSGERTNYTHMQTGSNDGYQCGSTAAQGAQVGKIGNAGSSSGPHIHISTLTTDSPEDPGASNWPNYFTNVGFASSATLDNVVYASAPIPGVPLPPQSETVRRQLDVGIPTYGSFPNGMSWEILPSVTPLPRNADIAGSEAEPNDTLAQHNALVLPASVQAELEDADVGDLAVRGDAIEDIFRVDLGTSDELRINLTATNSGENLDVYALTEDLRVINPTQEGTSPGGIEQMCLTLDAGAYYLMVTNMDLTTAGDQPYRLDVVSDPQSIAVTIEQGAASTEVDDSCEARVAFTIDLHDNCCIDEESMDLAITPQITTANAVVGAAVVETVNVLSETDIRVSGYVPVSNLTSCPAELRIDASAKDCAGHLYDTAADGGADVIDVLDTMPPVVNSSVATARLWPPDHELIDVGFARAAVDNCDSDVADTLMTEVWSDESETDVMGVGPFAPDAKDIDTILRLRAERQGLADGRVYLMTTDAEDACGNRAFACTTVGVPSSMSGADRGTLSLQEFAARDTCEAMAGSPPASFVQHGQAAEAGNKQ